MGYGQTLSETIVSPLWSWVHPGHKGSPVPSLKGLTPEVGHGIDLILRLFTGLTSSDGRTKDCPGKAPRVVGPTLDVPGPPSRVEVHILGPETSQVVRKHVRRPVGGVGDRISQLFLR